MKIKRNSERQKVLQKIEVDMSKDSSNPSRLSKWFKLMESKKKLFALEDDIDRLTRELQKKKSARS